MSISFSDYTLYLAKSSSLRDKIRHVLILPLQEHLLPSSFDPEIVDNYIAEVSQTNLYQERTRQVTYSFVDLILVTYLQSTEFSDALSFLLRTFRKYIVIHELASLAWGDQLVQPSFVFQYLTETEMEEKYHYHILAEMSITFPEETLIFAQSEIKQGSYSPDILVKLKDKVIKDRSRDRPLAKGVTPRLNLDMVKKLLTDLN